MPLRLGCVLAAAQVVFFAAGQGYDLVSQATEAFKNAQVNESVRLFDEAIAAGYPADRLWQRGISLYYADRFEDGSKQFHDDTAENPNDTEESIWAFVCDAQVVGFDQARAQMIVVEHDSRLYMQTLYSMYKGDIPASQVEALVDTSDPQDAFYYSLYLGLYEEAADDAIKAQSWITLAAHSAYATSGDYMGDVAVVHAKVRGWINNSTAAVV